MELWNETAEKVFFRESLKNFSSPEKLFYKLGEDYYAYIPKNIKTNNLTLQSRNSLIGQYTEKWCQKLFAPIAQKFNLHAVSGVICDELSLSKTSSADLAFCTSKDIHQRPENIKLIFEIKMSIVQNYKYYLSDELEHIGDYKTHKGQPSLLRSDSMLKAIGKAINIRVSCAKSSTIPIIILGNSPITESYIHKVDFLKNSGVVQGFYSLNPNPSCSSFIKETQGNGFITFDNTKMIEKAIDIILHQDLHFFSSMVSKEKLASIITIAARENSDIEKANKFLQLLRGNNE